MTGVLLLRASKGQWRVKRRKAYRGSVAPCPWCGFQFQCSRRYRRRAFLRSSGLRKAKEEETKSGAMSTASLLSILLQRIASRGLRRVPGIIQREAQKALTSSRFHVPIGIICSDVKTKRAQMYPWSIISPVISPVAIQRRLYQPRNVVLLVSSCPVQAYSYE